MVNLLIVSHSAQLAAGVQEFASQVAGDQVKIAAAGEPPTGRWAPASIASRPGSCRSRRPTAS